MRTSGIVTCACFLARTSRDEIEIEFLALNVHLEVTDVALDECNRPHRIHLCSDDIFAHITIPAESPVSFRLEGLLLL